MELKESEVRQLMVDIGRRLYKKGFISATDGNMSYRLSDNRFIITPSGICKGFMSEDALIIVNERGQVIEGAGKPSSEIRLHLIAYTMREDIKAVLHAHPPVTTAITLTKLPFDSAILPESWVLLGHVPVAPYATPSTEDLPEAVRPFIRNHNTIILERHGSITMASDLETAFFMLEKLEHTALIFALSVILSSGKVPHPLSPVELERLTNIFKPKNPVSSYE